MSNFVVPPNAVPALDVDGSEDVFAVRRILCVGRNYADHAREMGGDPDREPPFFFAKPSDAVLPARGTIPYPPLTSQLEYEIELVVALGSGGSSLSPAEAHDRIWGYGVGVDLTRRDRQQEAKDTRQPWELSKGFDASAPVSALVPVERVATPGQGRIWLAVNGEVKQDGDLRDMIWPVDEVVAAASRAWTLAAGDLFFTGTPSGVGPIGPGDVVTGGVDGIGEFEFTVGAAPA